MKKIFKRKTKSKQYIDELTTKIDELCMLYENYDWKDNERRLMVIFNSNMMITFYLYDEKEIVDDVILSFPKRDFKMYKDICLRIFAILLGNEIVHYENNIYYNEKHGQSLGIIIGEERVKETIDSMIGKQNHDRINLRSREIVTADMKVKRRVYSKKVIDDIGSRIDMSKNFLGK